MALTPEDVVNKRFQPTKFREGYDQDEVDDFLDEVVVELRRLGSENEELRQRLTAAESGAPQAAAQAPAPVFTAPEPAPAPVVAPVIAAAVPSAAAEAEEQASTTNLLQLARRLHEEHVREGAEKRDALIAEGHATAARVVAESEAKQRAQIGALEKERSALESKIDGLRTFEREYRAKLKSYIEGQLHDLESSTAPSTGFGGQATNSDAAAPSFQGFGV